MFRFENEIYLYGLLIIPFLVAGYIFIYFASKRKWRQFGDESLIHKLMPNHSFPMKTVKFSLLMAALVCFIFALANPQVGSTLEKGMRKGVDIMIALDISNSMLAEDIKPNRLEASKMALSRFIDQLKGDRIGLVVFAGKSFVQLPITSDYAAAKMFVNYVHPKLMNEQGTDIAAAIDLAAVSMLPETKSGNADLNKLAQLTSKVILVVSDGEDHFPEAVDVAAQVRKLGITIHTIGIGDLRGVPIPDGRGGNSYKKDLEGNTVITRLNEDVLKEIAAVGGGVYVHASNANMGFETILDKINSMNKVDLKEITFSRYESKFQYPLLLGLFFLLLEVLWFSVKSRWKELLSKFQFVLLACFIMSCDYNTNPIPPVCVDFTIYPNEVTYLDLNYDGGHMYFVAGVNGVVVYRISEMLGFSAFDRACPYDWEDKEAYLVVNESGIILECRKCGSLYNILDGSVIKGSSKYPLRQYYSKYDGMRLRIHS